MRHFIPSLKKYSFITVHTVVLVWGSLLVFEWVGTYFEGEQLSAYQHAPTELKLKASPKDVVYSLAYDNASGEGEVRYAYLTDEVTSLPGEDTARRTPNSQTEVLEVKQEADRKIETLKTTFYSGQPQFLEDKGQWRQVEYATTTQEVFSMSGAIPYIRRRELAERLIPGESAFATVSTYYPDANTESTSVDGYVSYDSTLDCNSGPADGTIADDSGIYLYTGNFYSWDIDNGFTCEISRSFLLFDTAGLPDGAAISSATMSVYIIGVANYDNDGSDTYNVVASTPASNTSLVLADYDQLGTTLQASAVDITSLSTGAYYGFALNATGLGNVTKTGVTKFGLRGGHDLAGTLVDVNTVNNVQVYSADQTGTSQDPKLEITYTTASFSMGQWFPF